MASVICDYKTSNGNRTCRGNASGLDGALSAVVKAEMVQMMQAEKAEMVQARIVEMVQ